MRVTLSVVAVSLALIACSEPGEPPEPVASVEVAPASDTIAVGQPQQFSARLSDTRGHTLTGRAVFWVSSDPDIASVSSTGMVTGVDNGNVTIMATSEGIQGSAAVLVQRPFIATAATLWAGHACALDQAGAAFCWGFNWRGVLGTGYFGEEYLTPARVAGGHSFTTITTWDHTCALAASGQAYCWGDNSYGKLGDGTTIDRLAPVAVAGGLTFADISAGGAATCGIVAGTAHCWGAGWLLPVGPSVSFASIALGDSYGCGVTNARLGYCWGSNFNGQLGDGTTELRSVPTPVSGGLSFASLVTGFRHSCGITTTGVTYCWGDNEAGQVGDNSVIERLVPTAVAGSHTMTAISAGWAHTCGVTDDGAGFCWGSNWDGALGDGTTTDRLTPTPVAGGHTFVRIEAGAWQSCGIRTDGSLLCWGTPPVGDGTMLARSVPTLVLME